MSPSLSLMSPSRVRLGLSVLTLSIASLVTSTASADSAGDKAAAEALFDEGVRLLKAGKVTQACKKLERSQAVDPGIGTLLYLGECYKKAGRTASAWAIFREAASKAEAVGEEERAEAGTKRADELESKLSRVLFSVDPANLQIEGFRVLQNGTELNRALWGSAVPLDPGALRVEASAPGYESLQLTIEVTRGPSEQELLIAALTPLPEGKDDEVSSQVLGARDHNEEEEVEDIERPLSGRRTAGLVLGGTGLVGLAMGGVFGVLALVNENEANKVCTGSTCAAGSDGVAHSDRAVTFGTVSTVGFVAGGVLLATGAVLYFTAPSTGQTAKIQLSPTYGGAQLALGSTF